ncbi:SDR family oxidoreductase [Boudabousia tangfeifanii]|nr:SDR family oxidoreductase [Boudabousia tangfeifanii]
MDKPVALITGASAGIGRAIALELAEKYRLILVARHEEPLAELAAELPDATYLLADLTDKSSVEKLAGEVPQLDVLINNAGMEAMQNVDELDWETWQQVLTLNVIAPAELSRLFLPKLQASHGQIVMINSGAGRFSGPGMGAYAASKHALDAYTKALRAELRPDVRVIAVHPGRVDTPMQQRMFENAGKTYQATDHLRPESIATAVAYALSATKDACVEEVHVRPQQG